MAQIPTPNVELPTRSSVLDRIDQLEEDFAEKQEYIGAVKGLVTQSESIINYLYGPYKERDPIKAAKLYAHYVNQLNYHKSAFKDENEFIQPYIKDEEKNLGIYHNLIYMALAMRMAELGMRKIGLTRGTEDVDKEFSKYEKRIKIFAGEPKTLK